MADRFMFFESYYRAAQKLSDEDRLKLYDGLCSFAFDGLYPEHDSNSMLGMAFTLAFPNVEKSVKQAENALKGGRPKKDANKRKQEKKL